MIGRVLSYIAILIRRRIKLLLNVALILAAALVAVVVSIRTYETWDQDQDRGAVVIVEGKRADDWQIRYLDQGWEEWESLWFYNTTQGSALIPYDFFLVLEQAGSEKLLRSDASIEQFRYLPQKATFSNPNALPVGFTKESYKGKDYVGFTCAACHTGQLNISSKKTAIRIDGGPALADMSGFLKALEDSMRSVRDDTQKRNRFVRAVRALDNDYGSDGAVMEDLEYWTQSIEVYNTVNNSTYKGRKIEYGHARLDAFGRIYNRVLQHVINRKQVSDVLSQIVGATGELILTASEIEGVLKDVGETIIGDEGFALILKRLGSSAPGYPGLSRTDLLRVRNALFNSPNAPVSYPFLWDIAQSDYVQWNGLASNAGPGPLGRNAGEVIGVFGILDWQASESWRTWLSDYATGQKTKRKSISFYSSVDLFNLGRLERRLTSLTSPEWPSDLLGELNSEKIKEGKRIYAKLCLSCHAIIDREDPDRRVIAQMFGLKKAGTDPAAARNSVEYSGKSGNFRDTYQSTDVGKVLVQDDAPVIQMLTAATVGTIATADEGRFSPVRIGKWIHTLFASLFDNPIKQTIKRGNYLPDTTTNPYNSLLAYKARPLNGIWATAPYLHNGSVPTLYDMLLPTEPRTPAGPTRPKTFRVGSREFDPEKVGYVSDTGPFEFDTNLRGNSNRGHQYGAAALSDEERMALLEYLKDL